jgi:predicted nucleic acid-binding protein
MPPGTFVFVDSNALVYSLDESDPLKQALAHVWVERLWSDRIGRLSQQVINEFYWNVTRKIGRPVSRSRAQTAARRLLDWTRVDYDAPLVELAWHLEDRFQLAWWDALIVAAAQRAGCAVLLTEDLQDGRRFGDVLVVDPFRHSPDEILGDGAGQVAEAPPKKRRPRRR